MENQKKHFLKKQRLEAYGVSPSAQELLDRRTKGAAANHQFYAIQASW